MPGVEIKGRSKIANYRHGGRVDFKTGSDDKWIQKAINPKHKGYCTPITKKTCTPHRKALALRFKKGGDLHKG